MGTGASSVWALAERAAGVPIDWSRVRNPSVLAERLLGQTMEELYDPENRNSLIYHTERRRRRIRRWVADRLLQDLLDLPIVSSLTGPAWRDRGDFGEPNWHEFLQPESAGGCYFYAALIALLYRQHPLRYRPPSPPPTAHDGQNHRHHFDFFRFPTWTSVTVDETIYDWHGSTTSRPVSRRGEWWPAVWQKAYGVFLGSGDSDFPRLGNADDALLALTGIPATAIRTRRELVALPQDELGRFLDAIVVDTPSRRVTRKGRAGWHLQHSYVALGVIRGGGSAEFARSTAGAPRADGAEVIVVYDPVGRRDLDALADLDWGALEGSPWEAYGRSAGVDSGVLPIPANRFDELFHVAWHCKITQ